MIECLSVCWCKVRCEGITLYLGEMRYFCGEKKTICKSGNNSLFQDVVFVTCKITGKRVECSYFTEGRVCVSSDGDRVEMVKVAFKMGLKGDVRVK